MRGRTHGRTPAAAADAPNKGAHASPERAKRNGLERAKRVRLMLFDVDGVLTDGRLWYGAGGEAFKAFSAHDGHGIRMLLDAGIDVGLLSGRASPAVSVRAAELGIRHVVQGIADKRAAFGKLLAALRLDAKDAGFMGDELVDLPVLRRCAFACAPASAHALVLKHAHYVALAGAGAGAVREVCEHLLRAQGRLDGAMAKYLR